MKIAHIQQRDDMLESVKYVLTSLQASSLETRAAACAVMCCYRSTPVFV
jgi:hypothetical protein